MLTMRSKAKVTYFCFTASQEYVGSLDISMNDAHRFKIEQSLEDIFYDGVSLTDVFLFTQVSLFESFREVSAFAVLVDGVAIIGSLKVLEAAYHIRVLQPPDDVDFLPKQVLNAQFLDLLEFHNLHSYLHILPHFFSSIYFGKRPLSQLPSHVNHIILNAFFIFPGGVRATPCFLLCTLPIKILNSLAHSGWLMTTHILSKQNKIEIKQQSNKNRQVKAHPRLKLSSPFQMPSNTHEEAGLSVFL